MFYDLCVQSIARLYHLLGARKWLSDGRVSIYGVFRVYVQDSVYKDSNIDLQPLDPLGYQRCRYAIAEGCLQGMAAFWDKQCEVYKNFLESHPRRQEFDDLVTLEDKLGFDPDLFMDTYFLDRRTTPDILTFKNFDWDQVRPAVARVETLHAKAVGIGRNKVLRIGWDSYDVMALGPARL